MPRWRPTSSRRRSRHWHAIDGEDPDALREELGDVLLQVVFHSRIAEESEDRPGPSTTWHRGWSTSWCGGTRTSSLTATAATASEVEANWEQLKAQERPRSSAVDGVPLALPALALSEKLLEPSVKAGLDLEVDEPDLPEDLTRSCWERCCSGW